MFEAMERGELRALYVIGENPAQSEADAKHTHALLEGLDHMIVQDIFLTRTAEMADVVLPASASWCETEGTVTNSERRVQRVRKALDPPGQARDDIEIICGHRQRLGHDWDYPSRRGRLERAAHALADARRHELRPARGARRHPVAVPRRDRPGRPVPARAAVGDAGRRRRERRSSSSCTSCPSTSSPTTFPIRLTTGRRLESYNTGVQTGGYTSPLRRGETLDLSPEDCERLERRGG